MPYPADIYREDLAARWKKTKDLARKKAVEIDTKAKDPAKTQAKAYDALDKAAFRENLGSNISKWPTLFPDYKKMKELLNGKIVPALNKYKAATEKSPLDASVKQILNTQFTFITNSLKTYDAAAKALDDADLASKQASGKIPPPILVLKHPDILRLAIPKAGALHNIDNIGTCPLEIVINDREILAKFPDDKEYASQAQKIKDAANFSKLVDDVADAIKEAEANVAANKPVDGEKRALQAKIEEAIEECAKRATDEAGRQGKLKGNARWANIKSGLKLTLTAIGVAAGATAIALTPLTLGVSTIAGCIALSRSAVELVGQIRTIGSEVETLSARVGDQITDMKKGYDKWLSDPAVAAAGGVSNKIGLAEFGKRGLNAIAPTWVTNIKTIKEGVESCEQKVNNIEVKSNDLSDKLSKLIVEQAKAEKAFNDFAKIGRDSLNESEVKQLSMILVACDREEKALDALIKRVIGMNERVSSTRGVIHTLGKEIKAIDDKNPIWSDVASALFETTASAGYMFASAGGAEKMVEFTKDAVGIFEKTHQAIEVLEATSNLAGNLKEACEKRAHR
jgi:hypothetical protein